MPVGDIGEAAKLHANSDKMFTISTQQIKALYLRDYVGSTYTDGKWSHLPYTAYTEDNAGMYKWLRKNGFDPITQVSDYYELGDEKDLPEPNRVSVDVYDACRIYGYVTAGFNKLDDGRLREDYDIGLKSRGFFGEDEYTYTEISTAKPSELSIVEDWVSNPRTPEQEKYSKAEAVYRQKKGQCRTLRYSRNACTQTAWNPGQIYRGILYFSCRTSGCCSFFLRGNRTERTCMDRGVF